MAFSSVSKKGSFWPSPSPSATESFGDGRRLSGSVIFSPTLSLTFLGVSPQEIIKRSRNIVPKAEVLYSMKFEDFKQLALNLKNLPLPGEPSHHKMAPEARIQWMGNNPKAPLKARKAGVMAIFYPDAQGRTRFLLILR